MRLIREIIIHCTATPAGRKVTVADVDRWHRQREFSGIGYHYLIGLNGEIWQGRTEDEPGAHCVGHNQNSIGVCYVGGLDEKMLTKDTRTPAQTAALIKLIRDLKIKYPQATIHGHNEYAAKACPCFDVRKWCKEVGL
ncbi:MAG: N-acetylmuramoyl-L-alanine amidase [Bacteroidales bacterium]|nr:N-acetylmuramoyl-L-alanine amidase [Bacteroidales bacterium]